MGAELTFKLKITMLSDWSVANGTGRQGSLDSLVSRDDQGLPFVPASTLRGIWRDAAETLARGLDDGDAGNGWEAIVDQIFGNQPAIDDQDLDRRLSGPVRSRLRLADGRFDEQFSRWLKDNGKKRFIDAMTFVKPGVAIDPATGSAKTDFLRFQEVSRAGAVLFSEAVLITTGNDEIDKTMVAFALAALVLIERLGGDRRRGAGKCQVELISELQAQPRSVQQAIEWLRQSDRAAPKITALNPGRPTIAFKPGSKGNWLKLAVAAEILSPTVIGSDVLGNLITSLKYIPGGQMLAFAERICGLLGIDGPQYQTRLAAGDIRMLPAYPFVAGARALPAPHIFEEDKDTKSLFRNQVTASPPKKQYKSIRGRFCAPEISGDAQLTLAATMWTRLETHNTVDDDLQKPTEKSGGGVYVYEAIAAGQRLGAELWIKLDRTVSSDAIDKLKGQRVDLSVGRAKVSGLGRVRLQVTAAITQSLSRADGSFEGASLWALSDIILPGGCASVGEAIGQLLVNAGVSAKSVLADSKVRVARREGWINAWGLPRPTLTVVEAGSLILLAEKLDEATVTRLASDGLGQRRAEGFGHVAVNALIPDLKEGTIATLDNTTDDERKPSPSLLTDELRRTQDPSFLALVETAALEALLESHAEFLMETAGKREELLGWSDNAPNPSQLGNLRHLVDQNHASTYFDNITGYLAEIAKRDKQASAWGTEAIKRTTAFVGKSADDLLADLKTPEREMAAYQVHGSVRDQAFKRSLMRSMLHAAMRAHKRAGEKVPATSN